METGRPDKVCGVHFFNPAPVMSLVEIVRPITAADETVAAARAFAEACGKTPVEVKDQAGFIVNAPAVPVPQQRRAAAQARVATKEDIDAAMKGGCGFPMGPFALLDLVGLDTSLAILDALYDEFQDPNYAAVPLLRRMVSAELSAGSRAGASTTTASSRPVVGGAARRRRVGSRPAGRMGATGANRVVSPASRGAAGPALDDADLLGPLLGPGLERSCTGPTWPRARPACRWPSTSPPRPATTPTPREAARRGRQGRRARRPPRPHAPADGRHPRRRDEHLDDDQRHRSVAARPLHRPRRGDRRRPPASCRARRRTTS